MCGIVGLFAKTPELEQQLGEHLAAMLVQLSDRGPDSAGVAIYGETASHGATKLTLFSADPLENWNTVGDRLREVFGGCSEPQVRASHALLVVDGEAADVEEWARS